MFDLFIICLSLIYTQENKHLVRSKETWKKNTLNGAYNLILRYDILKHVIISQNFILFNLALIKALGVTKHIEKNV